MKAELVNLVTKSSTETVVLLTTELDEHTATERVRALELTIWLVDEGWTVMTATESPLAPVVRKGAEAMHGTYRAIENHGSARLEPADLRGTVVLSATPLAPTQARCEHTQAVIARKVRQRAPPAELSVSRVAPAGGSVATLDHFSAACRGECVRPIRNDPTAS